MATARTRGPLPVGSLSWINDENAQIDRHCEQENEDFGFSVRNELEWLNEHMADIFAKDQLNFAEILKTPGKLRGKTPRTARKRDAHETREPLSTVFSATKVKKTQPPFGSHGVSPQKQPSTLVVAQDTSNSPTITNHKKYNTDSGYHGLSEDEMDIDRAASSNILPVEELAKRPPSHTIMSSTTQQDDRSTAERSFHSAREEITKTGVIDGLETSVAVPKLPANAAQDEAPQQKVTDKGPLDKDLEAEYAVDVAHSPSQGSSPERPLVRKSSLTFAALPAREPLNTKKSFGTRTSQADRGSIHQSTFLGRITGGKSLGGTKINLDESTGDANWETLDQSPHGREESDTESKMTKLHNKSSTQRLHERINLLGKSQAHRPTKSIPLVQPPSLAQSAEIDAAQAQQEGSNHLDFTDKQGNTSCDHGVVRGDEEEDWIQPPKASANAIDYPPLTKSISTDVMEGIGKKQPIIASTFDGQRNQQPSKVSSPVPQSAIYDEDEDHFRVASDSQTASPGIVSSFNGVRTFDDEEPQKKTTALSTTPAGSPRSHRYADGPLSASKSKLQSIVKSARGLFSSSAGVSAKAKLETLMADSLEQKNSRAGLSEDENILRTAPTVEEDRARSITAEPDPSENWTTYPAPPKTRSSTEKEKRQQGKDAKKQERSQPVSKRDKEEAAQSKDVDSENPAVKPVNSAQPAPRPFRQSPRKAQNQEHADTSLPENHVSHMSDSSVSVLPTRPQQPQRSKEPRRPIKPAKDAATKPKPQPVAIRVGMPSTQRIPLSNTMLSSTLSESLPPPPPKQQVAAKKPSLQSSTSNSNLKSSMNSATTKPKALLAAERKREQDEKEAQRKLEQKREIERRRAAQQEEIRRQELLQRVEIEKQKEREKAAATEDPRKLAQRQAIEKRRMDLNKKDQQKTSERPTTALGTTNSRPELGGSRPPSRQHNPHDAIRPVTSHHQVNNMKSGVKRVFEAEGEPPAQRSRTQTAPAYQQNESKRRKTESEEPEEFPMRPTHAPPIRQSGMRKDGPKASVFSNSNYSTAQPSAPHNHNGPSLLKSTTSNQAYQQHAHQTQLSRPGNHPDIKQYTSGKIPFAEHPNPPAQAPPPAHKPPFMSKTPINANNHHHQQNQKPYSPQYQNPETIHLDEIPTDSESESESEPDTYGGAGAGAGSAVSKAKPSNLPDWAQSPNLRQLLETQDERMDADAVFGPPQSPHIEEMFKERQHRFRSRTSSANWSGSGDRLTEEEIRKDVEARQRLRREGGWRFGL